ncbi:hypothetical protein ACJJID_00255 (plasmid) [Microbulbifer sp. CnH-101-G]|uniref:hypothetical protein n=1 Tax=Microbulbifer sp. CnH-101-G TaxID=3243393 RepID=UPI004039072D
MALQLRGAIAPQWYTPKDQDPKDLTAPQFLLQPLTDAQFMEIAGDPTAQITDSGGLIPSHAGRLKLLGWGLKNWRNIEDENGVPAEFKGGSWKKLPWHLQMELSQEVLITSALGAEAEKNLSSQSKSPATPTSSTAVPAATVTATNPTPPPSPNG